MSMKIITAFVFLILFAGRAFSVDSWHGYSLQIDNDPTPSFLGIIYQGQNYNPPQVISEMSEKIDRSSPETLLKSWLWAFNHSDSKVYNELFATNQLIEGFANDNNAKVNKLELTRIIQYADVSICEIKWWFTIDRPGYSQTNKVASYLFPVIKRNGEYFATEELLSDKAFKFMVYYYDFSPAFGPPHEEEFDPNGNNEAGFIYFTNFFSSNTNSPIVFRVRGETYGTNAIIDKWPTKIDQDLSSPTGTLASAVAALNAKDVERYSQLLYPEENTNLVRYGSLAIVGQPWDSIMREEFQFEASLNRPSAIRLLEQITYSPGVVALIYENAGCKDCAEKDVLYFKQLGTKWFISHQMEERGTMLMNYLGFGPNLTTKIFPRLK